MPDKKFRVQGHKYTVDGQKYSTLVKMPRYCDVRNRKNPRWRDKIGNKAVFIGDWRKAIRDGEDLTGEFIATDDADDKDKVFAPILNQLQFKAGWVIETPLGFHDIDDSIVAKDFPNYGIIGEDYGWIHDDARKRIFAVLYVKTGGNYIKAIQAAYQRNIGANYITDVFNLLIKDEVVVTEFRNEMQAAYERKGWNFDKVAEKKTTLFEMLFEYAKDNPKLAKDCNAILEEIKKDIVAEEGGNAPKWLSSISHAGVISDNPKIVELLERAAEPAEIPKGVLNANMPESVLVQSQDQEINTNGKTT